jgi:predicted negative regulator of RcsB-dependent stress response
VVVVVVVVVLVVVVVVVGWQAWQNHCPQAACQPPINCEQKVDSHVGVVVVTVVFDVVVMVVV